MKMRLTTKETGLCLIGVLSGSLGGYVSGTHGYAVDWASTGTMIQGWSALLAAVVAAWGVNRWQQELRFKRNAELAEKVLIAVEGLTDSLSVARATPSGYEVDQRVVSNRVLTKQSYELRLHSLSVGGHAAEIEAVMNRVSALFGAEHRKQLRALLDVTNVVRYGILECIGMISAIEAGRLDLEALHAIEHTADVLLPGGEAGAEFSQYIEGVAERSRELFRPSI
ncbi:TPA: hypothetical protein ACOEOH_001202 [Stenotrophomonas maltophilia]|jgi:hypothetical protein|nr:hypothetical protein [Stenotrophomonas geniculata]